MAAMLLLGSALFGIGAALNSALLMIVGGLLIVPVPSCLLIPALRISASRPRSKEYRDTDFIGGGMHVAGFTTHEIRDASESARDDERE